MSIESGLEDAVMPPALWEARRSSQENSVGLHADHSPYAGPPRKMNYRIGFHCTRNPRQAVACLADGLTRRQVQPPPYQLCCLPQAEFLAEDQFRPKIRDLPTRV